MIFLIFELVKKELKDTLSDAEGPLVKYNISYPEINKKTEFSKAFNGFYSLLAKRYCDFAKTKMLKEAEKNKTRFKDGFKPFGAVLRYICSYIEDNIISIVVDANVFCGGDNQQCKRLSQNWDVKGGRLLLYEDFFSSDDKKSLLRGIVSEANLRQTTGMSAFFPDYEKRLKKSFSKNDFYLTPKGYAFFYPAGAISPTTENEVFFVLGFKGGGEHDPY